MDINVTIKTAKIDVTTYNFELGQEQTESIITRNTTKRAIEKMVKEVADGKPCKYSVTINKETYTADIDDFLDIATKKED